MYDNPMDIIQYFVASFAVIIWWELFKQWRTRTGLFEDKQ